MRALSPKTLRELRDYLEASEQPGGFDRRALIAQVEHALKPKRSARPARERREAKQAAEDGEWRLIKSQVFGRAAGRCEHCGATGPLGMLDPDHFLGGNGRRKTMQSKFTVWVLCRLCHDEKGANHPSAAAWLTRFIVHARARAAEAFDRGNEGDANGYEAAASIAQARLESLELQNRGGA